MTPFVCDSNYFSNNDDISGIHAITRVPVATLAHYQIFAIDPVTGLEVPKVGRGRREASASGSSGSHQVSVSQTKWDAAHHAIVNNTRLPPGVWAGTLSAYHSILERNRVRLAMEQAELDRRKEAADISSQRRA